MVKKVCFIVLVGAVYASSYGIVGNVVNAAGEAVRGSVATVANTAGALVGARPVNGVAPVGTAVEAAPVVVEGQPYVQQPFEGQIATDDQTFVSAEQPTFTQNAQQDMMSQEAASTQTPADQNDDIDLEIDEIEIDTVADKADNKVSATESQK